MLHHQTPSDFFVGQIPFLEWKRPGFAEARQASEQPEERLQIHLLLRTTRPGHNDVAARRVSSTPSLPSIDLTTAEVFPSGAGMRLPVT